MQHQLPQSDDFTHCRGDPRDALQQWLARDPGEAVLLVDFELSQYWLPQAPSRSLTALYLHRGGRLQLAVTDRPLASSGESAAAQFHHWVEQHALAIVEPGQVLELLPLAIPKPWGQEIWYSGVEQRGVCQFGSGGAGVPIPWLQAVLPGENAGTPGEALVLLKILDPLPQEVTGDLYFELHREKQEVYVVTRVDESAWPGGTGYIRYGFDEAMLERYGEDTQFRSDYRQAVQAYEAVRRRLDEAGAAAGAAELQRERELREAMNRFTHMRPLRVGDVVKVPLLLPHSLQHGVRTVEFQTPVYERDILSFAQRVLTQDHWDTARAVPDMLLRAPPEEAFPVLRDEAGARVERIVDFSDFQVQRITLQPGASLPLQCPGHYAQLMVIDGSLALDGRRWSPENALLLPRGWRGEARCADPARPLVLLLATPR